MRSLSGRQINAVGARNRVERERVWVADSEGTLQDLTSWVKSWTVQVDTEEQARRAQVSFHREVDGESLAPLMSADPDVTIERRLKIEAAQVEGSETVGESDYEVLFDGTTDDAEWGGGSSVLSIPGRGPWGLFHDEWVEEETSLSGAVETVMASILTTRFGGGVHPITTVGDPDVTVSEYAQSPMRIAEALEALRDLNGWDLRYVWSDSVGDFVLTFQEPPSFDDPLRTFDAGDYSAVPDIGLYTSQRRRRVILQWSGGTVTVDDETLEEGERRKPMFLDFRRDGAIDTEAKALALATAVGRDVFQPPLRKTVRGRFFPYVALGDLYRFTGNLVHYLDDQDMAVTRFKHGREQGGAIYTEMSLYQRAVGSVGRWTSRMERDQERNRLLPDEEIEVPEVTADCPAWHLTVKDGLQGNTLTSTAAESLGRFVSTSQAPAEAGVDALFRDLEDIERFEGITLYRTLALVNATEVPWEGVRVYFGGEIKTGYTFAVGLDPEGFVDIDRGSAQGGESSDEESAPTPLSGSISFSGASDIDSGVVVGTIPTNQAILVHIRLTVAAKAESGNIGGRICAAECQPSVAEAA